MVNFEELMTELKQLEAELALAACSMQSVPEKSFIWWHRWKKTTVLQKRGEYLKNLINADLIA